MTTLTVEERLAAFMAMCAEDRLAALSAIVAMETQIKAKDDQLIQKDNEIKTLKYVYFLQHRCTIQYLQHMHRGIRIC